jgi:hypothetical protein
MKFYFDNRALNLSHVPEVKGIRDFKQFQSYYNVSDAEFVYTTEYNEKGVYLIETSKLTHQWTGSLSSSNSFNLIAEIPNHVITAAQKKQVRIVIISIVEGDHYVKDDNDGFRHLTDNIKKRNLPPFSVLIMAGNVKAGEEYSKWCKDNNEEPIIEFIGASEGPTTIPEEPNPICAITAQSRQKPYAFSSLNRAKRHHRTDHLYFLASSGLLEYGLVSGVDVRQHPKFIDVSNDKWVDVLTKNYPRTIDVNELELKTVNQANDINIDIYNNAMLSVVTETFFETPGLFFSEKIFKPIIVGSPQMVLTQPYAIKYMKDKFGINLKFLGLDTSYDSVEDPKERFLKFHNSLVAWVKTPDTIRRRILCSWESQLRENMIIARTTNFKKVIVDDIISSTTDYFLRD